MIVKGGGALSGSGIESPTTVLLEASEEEQEDMESLFFVPAAERQQCSMANGEKRRLTVRWSDAYGNKLAEVLEFQASDVSDPEEDESDACLCCIM